MVLMFAHLFPTELISNLSNTPPDPHRWIEVEVHFVFPDNFKPEADGSMVVGVYSEVKTYDLITSLKLKDIHPENPEITEKMWDNYFRKVFDHTYQGTARLSLKLNPERNYAITTFYDRNQNYEFNFFYYPREHFGFSHYHRKITWRKPYFDEISFSPLDYQDRPLIIKMK